MTIAPQGQKISDLLAAGPTLSFEFFPPKSDEAERQLEKAIHELAPLPPSFVSVTYGAGGSTRDRTRDIVIEVNRTQPFPAMPHLTCSGHTRAQITELLDEYAAAGIHNILALAGDPPADGSDAGGDFAYATELVEMMRDHPAWPPTPSCTPARPATARPTAAGWRPSWRSPTSPSRSSSTRSTTTCG